MRTFDVRRAAIDMQYLVYFVEEVMMHCNNAGTIIDTIDAELARARASTTKFDENSVPLTKKEKKIQKQIASTI